MAYPNWMQFSLMYCGKHSYSWEPTSTTSKPYQGTSPEPTVISPSLPPEWSHQRTTSQSQTISEQYQTIPGQCQNTPETPTEVKYIGYEYSNQTGHWYKFHAGPVVTWPEARLACERDGARLAVPNSDAEAKVIMSLHAKYVSAEITNTEWPDWVSVGIFLEDGLWKTVDGESLDGSGYARWMKGYPGPTASLCYVVMSRGGELSTTRSVLYPFVCEKEHVRAEITINYH